MTTAYETSDLNLAAFLMTQGHDLGDIFSAGGRKIFCFPANAQDDAKSYYRGALVQAQMFANSLRNLKTLLREQTYDTPYAKPSTHDNLNKGASHDVRPHPNTR